MRTPYSIEALTIIENISKYRLAITVASLFNSVVAFGALKSGSSTFVSERANPFFIMMMMGLSEGISHL